MTYKITIVLVIGLIGEACCVHDIMVLTLAQWLRVTAYRHMKDFFVLKKSRVSVFYLFHIMPKIVSSSVVSSSDHATKPEDQPKSLHVYYCLCSEFALVIDADLRQLPRRRTDNAIIVSNARRTYKLTAEAGECVLLKRFDP